LNTGAVDGFARARRVCLWAAVAALSIVGIACKEEAAAGAIRVRSIKFIGVHGVDESALRNALATRASSKLPWGTARYFYRAQFDDDLKRIQAFYSDRGFPDARAPSFDVKLNAAKDTVDATITITEGDPVIVSSLHVPGFRRHSGTSPEQPETQLSIKIGEATEIDRWCCRLVRWRSTSFAITAFHATVRVDEVDDSAGAAGGTNAKLTLVAVPGTLARFGPTEVRGNERVGENTIRRSRSRSDREDLRAKARARRRSAVCTACRCSSS
jgi:outer membrane protein assembly factor BamA